jgi:hypothetical protein
VDVATLVSHLGVGFRSLRTYILGLEEEKVLHGYLAHPVMTTLEILPENN